MGKIKFKRWKIELTLARQEGIEGNSAQVN